MFKLQVLEGSQWVTKETYSYSEDAEADATILAVANGVRARVQEYHQGEPYGEPVRYFPD